MKFRVVIVVAVLAALVGVWFWRARGLPQRADDEIVVGVIAPFGTTVGEGIRNGAAMAIEEVNARGGVLGQRLRAVEVDEEYSVDRAVQGYRQLASVHGAAAVVGVAGDGAFALMDLLPEYRVPILGSAVGADRLTELVGSDPKRYGAYFRLMHRSSELGEVTSSFARDFLFRRQGISKFAILRESAAWTETIARRWEETIRATPGMTLTATETFTSDTRDFAPVFLRLKSGGAGYVLDASSRIEATAYLKQWAASQGPPIGAIPTGAGTRRYYDELGDAGVSVSSVCSIPCEANQPTGESLGWWKRYVARYGDPEYTSAYSYDAIHVLAAAITRAGGTDPGSLVPALEATDHTGAAARWVFGPDHHPKWGPGYRQIPIVQYFEPGPYGFRAVWPEAPGRDVPFIRPPWWKDQGR